MRKWKGHMVSQMSNNLTEKPIKKKKWPCVNPAVNSEGHILFRSTSFLKLNQIKN